MTIRVTGLANSLDPQTTLYDLDPTIAVVGLDTLDLLPAAALILSSVASGASAPSASGFVTSTIDNSGAVAMNVPSADTSFDVTGAGIRVGILSDSFNAQGGAAAEEADGDLPTTVDILSDYTGAGATDEGRAMAELVHEVAPGAAIDFATANSTDQEFADGILALAAAGCNIIVDDVTYFDEPFFENSNVIQQAVETVIAEGVSYFTAASNEGTNFYQAAVDLVAGTLSGVTATMFEDFGATASIDSGSDILQDIDIKTGTTLDFDLQWTQPFLTDGSTTDIGLGSAYSLALYLFDPNGNLVVSTVVGGTGSSDVAGMDPVQVLQFSPSISGTYELAIGLNGGTATAAGGDTLKYIVYESYTTDGSQITIEDSNAGQDGGSITGHELVAGANTVGAVNANPPPADVYTPEDYSSYGPGTLDTYSATGVLTSTTVESKPNILAPDGISTSVSGFSSFYGTSAAAPDAAAVAALMMQANPNLLPDQITAMLEATATVVSGNTEQVGNGLVNADAAVAAANGDVWTAASGGTWDSAAAWSEQNPTGGVGAPGTGDPATLSNDFGTLAVSYTVTVNSTDAVADTLTVGNATTASVMPAVTLQIDAGDKLNIATGATVTQNGTLSVAGTGTLVVGGIAELVNATAMLTLQNHAVMDTAVMEIGTGALTIGSDASLNANGSIDIEIAVVGNFSTSYENIPYGLATGGGMLTVGDGGVLTITGGGGVLLGGSLSVDAGGTFSDTNSGGVAFLVLGGTLTDDGKLTEANGLLVNTSASVTVGAGGILTATTVDVEGTGATLTVAGSLGDTGALTGASTGHVTIADGGTLRVGTSISGAGVTLGGRATLSLATSDSQTLTADLTGTITLEGEGAIIDLAGLTYSSSDTLSSNHTNMLDGVLMVKDGHTTVAELHIDNQSGDKLTLNKDSGSGTEITVACYRHGTRIATPTDEVPIEVLRIGDPVLTASGGTRLIRWIGRRSYAAELVARERLVQPIRIRAGALGPSLPRRDLDVSPQHALLLADAGDVLVPAGLLVNGASILRAPHGAVTYFHIELEGHDAILAEGQPAETFINRFSRATFDNAADYAARYPDETSCPTRFCATRIEDGPTLARIRGRIDRRAGLRHGVLQSALDRLDPGVIEGWAHDPANPECPIMLEVVANGAVIGAVLADQYRADLVTFGRADGYCGFAFRLPAPLDARRRHILSVRRAADGAELRGMPALIDRPAFAAMDGSDLAELLATQIAGPRDARPPRINP